MPHSRPRSRSPDRSTTSYSHSRQRSRSPHRRHRVHRSNHGHKHSSAEPSNPAALPYDARKLTRHDLELLKPMFALYLDIQKNILIEDLSHDEIKGRWKSFINKWNHGELAEGWYDPQTFEKAKRNAKNQFMHLDQDPDSFHDTSQGASSQRNRNEQPNTLEDSDTESEYGPAMPSTMLPSGLHPAKSGPSYPSLDDIRLRREADAEESAARRALEAKALREDRRLDRKRQTEHVDEQLPRAEPNTRERQLEKRLETNASNRSFAASKNEGGDVELRDSDVMGGEDDLTKLKRTKEVDAKRKNEREQRREEFLMARRREREEKLKGMKEKEERTMDMLRELAKARFGGGEH